MSGRTGQHATPKAEYVIATIEVDPEQLQKLDTKMSSREKDAVSIKIPGQTNPCPIQLWEVYLAVAILCVQPHGAILHAHIKALVEHDESSYLCECLLREHLTCGNVTDVSQETSLFGFFEEYMHRKFQIFFPPGMLLKYVTEVVDDPLCGHEEISRAYLLGPFVQAFLVSAQYFEAQYDEMIDAMRMINLPMNDVMNDGEEDIGENAADVNWDHAKLYDDPNLVLKKYGGWAIGKAVPMLTKKDQLVMRLTGCTLEQLLSGKAVPDSPRDSKDRGKGQELSVFEKMDAGLDKEEGSDEEGSQDDSSHASDYQIDPEHPRINPFGISLCEAYCLMRGLHVGSNTKKKDWKGFVVGQNLTRYYKDGHILAACVLVDLYMREQIDVYHWTLSEGNVAVPYKVTHRRGMPVMDHFLDYYVPFVDVIFRDMRLPSSIGEAPIWDSLERRGIIDNHRPSSSRRFGLGRRRVDVWDLVRADLLLDLREGYVVAGRVLYDRQVVDPMDEEPSDVLMFCFLLQYLFDVSIEALNGFSRAMNKIIPPFMKGELFPPLTAVHAGAVCMGIIDRGSRIARNQDVQLAYEAAEFNEVVMQRLEEKFFLSPEIFKSMDSDQSGELSMDEFVEGMKAIDVYKDFRRERVPDDVLRMIVSDLAERLFQEVDVNGDGTLTLEEIGTAFRRRREEALKMQQKRQWFRNGLASAATKVGIKKSMKAETRREEAVKLSKETEASSKIAEQQKSMEWQSEMERLEFMDEEVDVDTGLALDLTGLNEG
eukprot:TRINITY_DN109426_c0_g1_i1.p1 TRINITY_DN109426_c0_g1~~TRINITY_DN109426_c0_g1_i1.p1  ORF type:complete len:767 (+),score=166.70 TRINITY_DN109426_c0_g1_i1:83-2383(+)